MDSLQGHFLIAAPQLPDPNFLRTVVLIVQHDSNGAFGIVLNRPSDLTVSELWSQVEDSPCESEDYVAIGGPVEGPILVVHGDASHSETEVIPGVHLASDREYVRHIINNNIEPYRVYSGYAGWGNGQLETEIKLGGWLATEATREFVFRQDVSEMWQSTVNLVGRQFFEGTLGIDEFPDDVSSN